jgi:lysozyme
MKKISSCLVIFFLLAGWNEAQAVSYVYGIDVSKWQGTINWSTVKNSGQKQFAFVKATEGVGYVDPTFTTNMNGSFNAGLYTGAYHFATPYTNGVYDAVNEANDFCTAIMPYITRDKFIRPVLDLESGSSLGSTVLSNWTNAFMNQVKARTGLDPIIYCNSNYANNYLNSTVNKWDLWIANWTYNPYGTMTNTGAWSNWKFWQYSDSMTIPGISSSSVDGDAFQGTLADLARYAVPEPATLALLAMGGLGFLLRKW